MYLKIFIFVSNTINEFKFYKFIQIKRMDYYSDENAKNYLFIYVRINKDQKFYENSNKLKYNFYNKKEIQLNESTQIIIN